MTKDFTAKIGRVKYKERCWKTNNNDVTNANGVT